MLGKVGEEKIGPDKYRTRSHVTAETEDEGCSWLNQAVIMASAGRGADQIEYDAFEIL